MTVKLSVQKPLLVIDGSYGEGGGQVLRSSVTLASLCQQPIRVENIRWGRRKPGLRPQHLTAVRAAAAICGARLEGDRLGSEALTYVPTGPVRPGTYVFDVAEAAEGGSAGSVGLILQTVLLPLAMARGESRLVLRGGTHVPWAPSVSYLEHVFLPTLARMGAYARLELARWGFYPAGGGEISVHIPEQEGVLNPVSLMDRGELRRVWGMAVVTNLPAHIPQRMATRARNLLAAESIHVRVDPIRNRGAGPGAGLFVFAEYAHAVAGFTAYGRPGLPSEQVAENACEELLAHHHSGASADPYLPDQIALPFALAVGHSRAGTSRVSQHLLTNVWIVRQFLPVEVYVEGERGTPGTLMVKARRYD